jgi:nitrate/nitrite transporter NarK
MLMLMDSPLVPRQNMGLASGVFFAVAEIGGFSGPLLMGTLYDVTGSFLTGIGLLACLNAAIFWLSFGLKDHGSPVNEYAGP